MRASGSAGLMVVGASAGGGRGGGGERAWADWRARSAPPNPPTPPKKVPPNSPLKQANALRQGLVQQALPQQHAVGHVLYDRRRGGAVLEADGVADLLLSGVWGLVGGGVPSIPNRLGIHYSPKDPLLQSYCLLRPLIAPHPCSSSKLYGGCDNKKNIAD